MNWILITGAVVAILSLTVIAVSMWLHFKAKAIKE